MKNLDEIIAKLKIAFTKDDVKKAVIKPEWYPDNIKYGIDSLGFCYAATEVIYRLCGGKEKWKVMSISSKDWADGSHYYLQDKNTNEILDITADQYTARGISIPYALGNGKGYRFGVSNQARKLAEAIGEVL
jgi:hypothetical protein